MVDCLCRAIKGSVTPASARSVPCLCRAVAGPHRFAGNECGALMRSNHVTRSAGARGAVRSSRHEQYRDHRAMTSKARGVIRASRTRMEAALPLIQQTMPLIEQTSPRGAVRVSAGMV